MSKLLLMGSMVMMIVLPIRAARLANAQGGLKRAITTTLLFNVLWAMVVLGVFWLQLRNPAALFPESVSP